MALVRVQPPDLNASVAQSAEQRTFNPYVVGSTPTAGTRPGVAQQVERLVEGVKCAGSIPAARTASVSSFRFQVSSSRNPNLKPETRNLKLGSRCGPVRSGRRRRKPETGGSNPSASTILRDKPFGENVEGLSHC